LGEILPCAETYFIICKNLSIADTLIIQWI
jgi:hypothetical protein